MAKLVINFVDKGSSFSWSETSDELKRRAQVPMLDATVDINTNVVTDFHRNLLKLILELAFIDGVLHSVVRKVEDLVVL